MNSALPPQAAPSISIEASGSATVNAASIDADAETVLPVAAAVPGDARPLRVMNPDFLLRDIGQTSTAPCSGFSPVLFCFNTNTITVTLKVKLPVYNVSSS